MFIISINRNELRQNALYKTVKRVFTVTLAFWMIMQAGFEDIETYPLDFIVHTDCFLISTKTVNLAL